MNPRLLDYVLSVLVLCAAVTLFAILVVPEVTDKFIGPIAAALDYSAK